MKLIYLNETSNTISSSIFEAVLDNVTKYVSHAKHEDVELLITNNSRIQELNRQYRQKDSPTDVLSFAFEDNVHLGQVVISIEKAKIQAYEVGNTLEEELRFLFCHGVLHNLGYDHEFYDEEQKMLAKTYQILGRKNF